MSLGRHQWPLLDNFCKVFFRGSSTKPYRHNAGEQYLRPTSKQYVCFLLLHNRVGLHACHKKVGLAPSSQLSLKCISASSLCNFERLILGSVVSACHSGSTNSATGSYFRCPGIIFQMPRNHISDAQASYFRCLSIQRRYNETLAFTGTEPLQIDLIISEKLLGITSRGTE